MISQAVACFAPEAPWRDWLTTKVIKSSQIQFILLIFKKYEESIEFQDITCICLWCLFNLKNVCPMLHNTHSHTFAKSSELNASTLLLNLVRQIYSWSGSEMKKDLEDFGSYSFYSILLLLSFLLLLFIFFFLSKFSLTSVKQSELHPLEKCTFLLPTWPDWPGLNINTGLPTITTDHTFFFLSAAAICKSLKQ